MKIAVNITLESDDALLYTPDAAAGQVLAALGANPAKDHCIVYVTTTAEPGSAGTPPPALEPPPDLSIGGPPLDG